MKVIARFVPNRAGIPIIAKRMRYTNAQANHDWFLVNRWLDRLDAAGIVDSDAVCWFVSVNPAREMERELQ